MSSLFLGSRIIGNLKRMPSIAKPSYLRYISTSKKNSDETTTVVPTKTEESIESDPLFTNSKTKNWISYGFSDKDYKEDRVFMHLTMFSFITLLIIGSSFTMAYKPDYEMVDWAQRQAYLELRRREELGLPLIDPDYLPQDKIILPSDEELGDTEIVI